MTLRRSFARIAVVVACVLASAGCSKKEEAPPPPVAETPKPVPFRILAMDLGKRLDADKKVVEPTVVFGVRDTIHLSIASEGTASNVTLRALWKFEDGQVVADDAQLLAPTGAAQSEFHILKNSPWPKGKYTVEVFTDTTTAGKKEFMVQ